MGGRTRLRITSTYRLVTPEGLGVWTVPLKGGWRLDATPCAIQPTAHSAGWDTVCMAWWCPLLAVLGTGFSLARARVILKPTRAGGQALHGPRLRQADQALAWEKACWGGGGSSPFYKRAN